MKDVQIDILGKNGSVGQVASQLRGLNTDTRRPFIAEDGLPYISVYKGGDPNDDKNYETQLVTNATLRRDEWKLLDEAVLKIQESRLGGIQDLIDNNLVFNIGNGMGTTVFEYHDISDALSAELTMDGVTRAQNDRPDFTTNYLPLPVIHADYEINARVLESSRRLGIPLDTTLAERATRKVLLKLEQMLFTNTTYTYGGGTIYSYLNHPHVNAVTLHNAWEASAGFGDNVLADVLEMKQALLDNHFFGPFRIYIPSAYETVMDSDYSASKGSNTIRERVLQVGGISGVKVIDTLPANTVLMVNMAPETVRLVTGLPLRTVEWGGEGGWVFKYKVVTIQVPQVRADQEGHCGVVKLA